jgi:hypothetical protein
MDTPWTLRVADSIDSPEALPREMGWDEAQSWCNFVLMELRTLPDGFSMVGAEMRPEAPPGRIEETGNVKRPDWTTSNRSCHRALISDGTTTVRIKQFLYDWAPPAFDHPSLWRSRPRPRSFRVGDDVGWTGTDFRGQPAAAIQIDRTTVEVAVIRGQLDDEGFRAICHGLEPVAPAVRRRIVDTPLATLCYQARHREDTIEVPTGYWRHRRDTMKLLVEAVACAEAPEGLPGRRLRPASASGYRLDSVFIYRAAEAGPVIEADYVYETPDNPGRYLRILASPCGTSGGVVYPPVPDEQDCNTTVLGASESAIYHAYLEELGPHEAVWQEGGDNIILLCKPAAWTDLSWFKRLLAELTR